MSCVAFKFLLCVVVLEGNVAKSIKNVTSEGNRVVTVDMLELWKKNMTDMITDLFEKKRMADEIMPVYFYAKMTSTDKTYNTNSIVKFSNVLNNGGNHFNSGDSIFISPVSGIYLFSWTTQTYGGKTVNTELRVDNVVKETLHAGLGGSVGTLSVTRVVICNVKKSDHVWIQTSGHYSENLFDYGAGSQSSFTGVLLYQL